MAKSSQSTSGKYVDFDLLKPEQREQVRKLRPNRSEKELSRFMFWVKPDGTISRRKGHHTLTRLAAAELDAQLKDPAHYDPAKGGILQFKTGSFGL